MYLLIKPVVISANDLFAKSYPWYRQLLANVQGYDQKYNHFLFLSHNIRMAMYLHHSFLLQQILQKLLLNYVLEFFLLQIDHYN